MAQKPDADSVSRIVMLTYGAMEKGGQYWCYVAVKPSRHQAFKKVLESKQYNIQDFVDDGYGEIIVSGEGVVPPQDVTTQVAKMFSIPVKELFKDIHPEKTITQKLQAITDEQPPV